MSEVVLETRGLFAGYGGTAVVRGLDLKVRKGEIVALVGPNGAGKTTVLMTMAGFLPPIAGEATVAGIAVGGARPHKIARNGVCLVPEQRSLLSSLTARENLELGRRRGNPPVDSILEHFPELESRMNVRAGLLSGGEQQMLAMGWTLINRPQVLMIDEMSLGLAPTIVERLLRLLEVIVAETGCGVLLVEQQVRQALAVSARAYVLNHGNLEATAASAELLADERVLDAAYLRGQKIAERETGK